jgi:hypothetical protein
MCPPPTYPPQTCPHVCRNNAADVSAHLLKNAANVSSHLLKELK